MSTRSVALTSTALAVVVTAMWLVEVRQGSGIEPRIPDAEVEFAVPPPATKGVDATGWGDENVEAGMLHADALAGVWLQVGEPSWSGLLVWFDPNERRFAIDDVGRLPATNAKGTFELVGDRIVFQSEGTSLCNEGDRWEWRVSRMWDALQVIHTRSSPPPCRIEEGTEWILIRVSPASSASDRAHLRDHAGRLPIWEEVHPSDRRFHIR